MVGGVPKHQFGALGSLEVEVCWVFPGKSDTPVNLNVLQQRSGNRLQSSRP